MDDEADSRGPAPPSWPEGIDPEELERQRFQLRKFERVHKQLHTHSNGGTKRTPVIVQESLRVWHFFAASTGLLCGFMWLFPRGTFMRFYVGHPIGGSQDCGWETG